MARPQALGDHRRLSALLRSGLLDSPVEEAFDRATRLASAAIGTPVSLVSIVDRDRQFFKSALGLPEPWASQRETPLSHSFCQYVVMSGDTLSVADAREDVLLRDNGAIEDLGVVAYLGVPIVDDRGNVLGSFCVIDDEPREWTQQEESILRDIAEQVHLLLLHREALEQARRAELRRRNVSTAVTHDLRGPAANILAASSMLSEVDEEDRATFLDIIDRQARRIERLVTGLASAERAGEPGRTRVLDLGEHVRATVERAFAGRHEGRIHVEVPDAEIKVEADPDAVAQVLLNLVDNAVRHGAPSGRVHVRLRADDEQVELDVVNEAGPAVPDLDVLLSTDEGGRRRPGLGLHICQAVLDALGGHLIASRADDEVTFRAVLPLHLSWGYATASTVPG